MSTNPNPFGYLPLTGGTVSGDLAVGGHTSVTAPVIGAAAGGNAGTGPPAPVVPTGTTDGAGQISFGTGTLPAAGVMAAMTFGKPWVVPGGGAPHIVVSPLNTATAALGIYPSGVSPTGFNLSCQTAPAASQGNTVYQFAYHVLG